MSVDREYLKHLTDVLAVNVDPERIYLFGSCARGEDTEDSDIDLLLIKDTDLPRYERAREIGLLIRPRKYPLDLLIYTPGEFEELKDVVGTIPYKVAREGVLLYGRATQEAH